MPTLKLVYWDIRGFAEPIRNLLRYKQVQFEDVRLNFGSEENFPNKDQFRKTKHNLGLDFPNLPYLVDGEVKLSQSQAIIKYLARKFDLRAPSTDPVALAVEDMTENHIIDIRDRLLASMFKNYRSEQEWADEVNVLKADLASYLSELEVFMREKQWLLGDMLSYVDFLAYEYLDWYRDLIQPDCFANFPQMSAYMARFEGLGHVSEYLASEAYRGAHIVGPSAKLDIDAKHLTVRF